MGCVPNKGAKTIYSKCTVDEKTQKLIKRAMPVMSSVDIYICFSLSVSGEKM